MENVVSVVLVGKGKQFEVKPCKAITNLLQAYKDALVVRVSASWIIKQIYCCPLLATCTEITEISENMMDFLKG